MSFLTFLYHISIKILGNDIINDVCDQFDNVFVNENLV